MSIGEGFRLYVYRVFSVLHDHRSAHLLIFWLTSGVWQLVQVLADKWRPDNHLLLGQIWQGGEAGRTNDGTDL